MRLLTVLSVALASTVLVSTPAEAGAVQLLKKKAVAKFVFTNDTPFGLAIALWSGDSDDPVYEVMLEPDDEATTEQSVFNSDQFRVGVNPLISYSSQQDQDTEVQLAMGRAEIDPIQRDLNPVEPGDCVDITVIFSGHPRQLDLEIQDGNEDDDDRDVATSMSRTVRESVVIAGSASGLLLLTFVGSFFARAPRRPEDELSAE